MKGMQLFRPENETAKLQYYFSLGFKPIQFECTNCKTFFILLKKTFEPEKYTNHLLNS